MIQRGLEDAGNFKRIMLQVIGKWDGADKGHHVIAVYRIEIIQTPEDFYLRAGNPQLFFRFTQGRGT